jgi:RNA polymerase sigma-70 factor (ECF subfamily)
MRAVDWMKKSPGPEVLIDGDGHAAARQIEELAASGFAMAMQVVGNRDDAADVVQDSFHALIRKRRTFDPARGHLKAWFLKIVRNRGIDLLRKRGRREATAEGLSEISGATDDRPDVAAERRELLDLLKRQLMAMPQGQREIILLRDYHDLSYAEIAAVLSIPPGTVMSRLHRARLGLKRRMASADR